MSAKETMFELPQEYSVYSGEEPESTPVHDALVALMGAYGREHGLHQNLHFRVELLDADGRVVRRYLGTRECDHENGMLRVDTSVYLGTRPKEEVQS